MSTDQIAASPSASVDPPRDVLLASFLATRDVPCPNPRCGFNLRGLNESACPECGEALRLAVVRPEALWFMRKWVFAAAIVLTVTSLAWSIVGIRAAIERGRGSDWSLIAVPIGIVLGTSLAIVRCLVSTKRNAIPRLLASFITTTLLWNLLLLAGAIAVWVMLA